MPKRESSGQVSKGILLTALVTAGARGGGARPGLTGRGVTRKPDTATFRHWWESCWGVWSLAETSGGRAEGAQGCWCLARYPMLENGWPRSPLGGRQGLMWPCHGQSLAGEAVRQLRVVTDSDGSAEVVWKHVDLDHGCSQGAWPGAMWEVPCSPRGRAGGADAWAMGIPGHSLLCPGVLGGQP